MKVRLTREDFDRLIKVWPAERLEQWSRLGALARDPRIIRDYVGGGGAYAW
jgi:hypothetical protein